MERSTSTNQSQANAAENLQKFLYDLVGKVEVWKSPGRKAWATIGFRNVPVGSPDLREWLAHECWAGGAGVPTRYALDKVVSMLQGKAIFAGPQHNVSLRVADHDGAVWIDLANAKGQAVRLTADGWEVKAAADVEAAGLKFWRPPRMRSLPMPARADADQLRPLVNVASDSDYRLLLTFMTAALLPQGPYSVLALLGQQGSAKSDLTRSVRALTDPSDPALHRAPREERDLDAAARNNHVVALDNLSSLVPWLADAICRLATGGGMGGRKLYTDADEEVFEAQRPVVVNGIANLVTRGDLAERALVLDLPPINPRRRLSRREVERRLQAAAPGALAMLLDAMAAGLKRLPELEQRMTEGELDLPRMADFALWGMAVAPALGWTADDFLRAYAAQQVEANETVLQSEPAADAIEKVLACSGDDFDSIDSFEGTMTELLAEMNRVTAHKLAPLPKSAAELGTVLRRIETALKTRGIMIEHKTVNGRRLARVQSMRETLKLAA